MAHFEENNKFLLRFLPFYWFDQKQLFKQIQIFLRICSFSNMLRNKQTFWLFQCFFQRLPLIWLKRVVLCEFPQKCFKTTEKHSLAVCGSLWIEKQFLLIFDHFYWFVKKVVYTNPYFPQDFSLFKHVKKNKPFVYFRHTFWYSHIFE